MVDFSNGVPFFALFLCRILDFSRVCQGLSEKVISALDRARRVLSHVSPPCSMFGSLSERIVAGNTRIQARDILRLY